jgi:hypothetical protein
VVVWSCAADTWGGLDEGLYGPECRGERARPNKTWIDGVKESMKRRNEFTKSDYKSFTG